eukprot:GEMP01015312.1.p1 GENE.GEMP01015312.1~~GEMP01015312.1.p1  ORF type:complete len:342 (+),score=87.66 GEMP01015312.1:1750-2775(+)
MVDKNELACTTSRTFREDILSRHDIIVPQVYACVRDQDTQSMVIMEDVVTAQNAYCPSMITDACKMNTARSILTVLAVLHAATWGSAGVACVTRADKSGHPTAEQSRMVDVIEARHFSSGTVGWCCLQKLECSYPGLLPPDVSKTFKRALANWDTLCKHFQEMGHCVAHGDAHLGNFYFLPPRETDRHRRMPSADEEVPMSRIGVTGWQRRAWDHGARDVAYFLATSIPSEALEANGAAMEKQLLEHYRGTLLFLLAEQIRQSPRKRNNELRFPKLPVRDEWWNEYRLQALYAMYAFVLSSSIGNWVGKKTGETRVAICRIAALMQRVKTDEALDKLLSTT